LIGSWKTLLDTGCGIFIPGHGTANNRALLKKCYEKRAKN
jgi:hydroxyacylglutathione hydrolase